jgi:Mg-chelatase subunit ChlD
MLVLIAFMLVAYFVTVVFSVDVAYMHLVRTQLRSSTDAAAKASVDLLSRTERVEVARQAARTLAGINQVAGDPLLLSGSDLVFGSSRILSSGAVQFIPGATPLSAARLSGRRTQGSASGEVPLFFAGLLGVAAFEPQVVTTASRQDRDICLVVDRSGSMAGQKIIDLKAAVAVFLQTLQETPQEEWVGLASYATTPSLESELTQDMAVINLAMQRMPAHGFTNIGGGIDVGRGILQRGRGSGFVEKTMVLMTDGRHNTGIDPIQAAQRARQDGVVIHAITFGSGAEQARMRQVAAITGGTFNHAPNGQALIDIYREIALTLLTTLTE